VTVAPESCDLGQNWNLQICFLYPIMTTVKVFVGNLDFKTREAELANEFGSAGKVISANIITRGPRSLGYGFVEMESLKDAESAVAKMNQKDIDGRPINVEIAKPREERGDIKEASFIPRGRGRGGHAFGVRGGRGGAVGVNNEAFIAPRGGGRGGTRQRYRRTDQQELVPLGKDEEESARPAKRGGFRRRPFRPDRGVRNNSDNSSRVESTTTLFVANLPFSIDDDTFGKIFADRQLAYKSAHVVKKRNQRSKGFGFVEFENQSDQQKALASINGTKVEDRELTVKVALTELPRGEDSVTSTTTVGSGTNSNASGNKAEPKDEPKKQSWTRRMTKNDKR